MVICPASEGESYVQLEQALNNIHSFICIFRDVESWAQTGWRAFSSRSPLRGVLERKRLQPAEPSPLYPVATLAGFHLLRGAGLQLVSQVVSFISESSSSFLRALEKALYVRPSN